MSKFLLFIFLISCSATINKNTKIPDWYLNPPQNNLSSLYGVGYGSSLDQAVQIALNNVAEKISVTVSSSFVSSKQESSVNDNSLYEAAYEQDVDTQVQEINFTNYKTEKSEQIGQYVYSLVQVSRNEVIENYMKKIRKLDAEISSAVKDIKTLSAIEQFARLYRIRGKIKTNEVNLKIVETIEKSDFSVKDYYDKYNNLAKLEAKVKNKIIIKIVAKPSDKKAVVVLAKAINDLGIKTNNKLNPKDKGHALLRVVTYTKNDNIYGTYLAKVRIEVKLLENFGDQISSGLIEVSGSSAINSAGAVDAAIASFTQKIKEKGLLEIIGL